MRKPQGAVHKELAVAREASYRDAVFFQHVIIGEVDQVAGGEIEAADDNDAATAGFSATAPPYRGRCWYFQYRPLADHRPNRAWDQTPSCGPTSHSSSIVAQDWGDGEIGRIGVTTSPVDDGSVMIGTVAALRKSNPSQRLGQFVMSEIIELENELAFLHRTIHQIERPAAGRRETGVKHNEIRPWPNAPGCQYLRHGISLRKSMTIAEPPSFKCCQASS